MGCDGSLENTVKVGLIRNDQSPHLFRNRANGLDMETVGKSSRVGSGLEAGGCAVIGTEDKHNSHLQSLRISSKKQESHTCMGCRGNILK